MYILLSIVFVIFYIKWFNGGSDRCVASGTNGIALIFSAGLLAQSLAQGWF